MRPDRDALEQPILVAQARPAVQAGRLDAAVLPSAPRAAAGAANPIIALRDATMSFQSVTALRNSLR